MRKLDIVKQKPVLERKGIKEAAMHDLLEPYSNDEEAAGLDSTVLPCPEAFPPIQGVCFILAAIQQIDFRGIRIEMQR